MTLYPLMKVVTQGIMLLSEPQFPLCKMGHYKVTSPQSRKEVLKTTHTSIFLLGVWSSVHESSQVNPSPSEACQIRVHSTGHSLPSGMSHGLYLKRKILGSPFGSGQSPIS